MKHKKFRSIMQYSFTVENLLFPLNEKIKEAYELGYNPLVEVKTCPLTGNKPIIVITFFPPNDNDSLISHTGQKCCR
jgi:hypothetical protein